MSIEHGDFTPREQWQQADRERLVAGFRQFLMEPGRSEIGGRVDNATMEYVPGKSYGLDNIEEAVERAREHFEDESEYIRKSYVSYYPPVTGGGQHGSEKLELVIIGIGRAQHDITVHKYDVAEADTVEDTYTHARMPQGSSPGEMAAMMAFPDSRPMEPQDFGFLKQLLAELNRERDITV